MPILALCSSFRQPLRAALAALVLLMAAQPARAEPPIPIAPEPADGSRAESAPSDATARAALRLLRDKGIISQLEYDEALAGRLSPPPATPLGPPVRSRWDLTLYGFAELDSIYDSTQSYNEVMGNAAVLRPDTYGGTNSRLTFSVRNSRIGLRLRAPTYHRVTASAVIEADFLGNQPPQATEAQTFTNPALRVRHFFLKLETPYLDLQFGQAWQLFGLQTTFFPNTVQIQGVPGEVFGRSPQIRLSRTLRSREVNLDIALGASRPPQRDGWTPDGQAALLLTVNRWRGMHTANSTGTAVLPASFGVSALMRHFAVPELLVNPRSARETYGYGIHAGALIPVVRASDDRRGNSLTLVGNFAYGQGIADQFTGLTGGVAYPRPLDAAPGVTAAFNPDIDAGLVNYTADGTLQTIQWQAFLVGAEYYLPGKGNVWLSANFSQTQSDNAAQFGNTHLIFNLARWADANLFWDATPAARFGLEYSFTRQYYADRLTTTAITPEQNPVVDNHRVQFSAFYLF